jgi:hypothetical protein
MPIHAALDEAEIRALEYALDDEYKSHETYAQVIRDFGDVRPFINIVEAEARHSAALLSLFERYGVAPPATRWVGNAPRFDSVHAACVAAVQGEIDNVKLFKRVLESTRRPDILGGLRGAADSITKPTPACIPALRRSWRWRTRPEPSMLVVLKCPGRFGPKGLRLAAGRHLLSGWEVVFRLSRCELGC